MHSSLADVLGLSSTDISGIAHRVCCIMLNNVEDIRHDTYVWVEKMNICKTALAELHTHYHRSEKAAWLQHIANVYEIFYLG